MCLSLQLAAIQESSDGESDEEQESPGEVDHAAPRRGVAQPSVLDASAEKPPPPPPPVEVGAGVEAVSARGQLVDSSDDDSDGDIESLPAVAVGKVRKGRAVAAEEKPKV